MRDSIIEKWERELESDQLVELDFIIPGLPNGYYEENVDDTLAEAIEAFCKRHHYSEKTAEEMINCIPVRDAYYKMLEREGYLNRGKTNG